MVHRMLPVKLAQRAIPLFYFIVSLAVMALPGRVDLALGAAGLISMIHVRLGENLAHGDPPDMQEVFGKLYLGWDYIVKYLQTLPVSRVRPVSKEPTVHDDAEDDNPGYQEPPSPPEAKKVSRIPQL